MNFRQLFTSLAILLTFSTLKAYNNTLEVVTNQSGVEVYLGKKLLGKTSHFGSTYILSVDNIKPGDYTLKCFLEEHLTYKEKIKIPATGTLTKRITLKGKTSTINVTSKPTGATIRMDGRAVGQTNRELTDLPLKDYSLVLSYPGVGDLKTSFRLTSEKPVNVVADFLSNAITTDIVHTVTINATPAGTLYIDGKNRGTTPQTLTLAHAEHDIRISGPNAETYKQTIYIASSKTYNFTRKSYGSLDIDVEQDNCTIEVAGERLPGRSNHIAKIETDNAINIAIYKIGYESLKFQVPIETNTTTYIEATLSKNPKEYIDIDDPYVNLNWQKYYKAPPSNFTIANLKQFGKIVVVETLAGALLDILIGAEQPVFTIVFGVVGVGLGIYLPIYMQKDESLKSIEIAKIKAKNDFNKKVRAENHKYKSMQKARYKIGSEQWKEIYSSRSRQNVKVAEPPTALSSATFNSGLKSPDKGSNNVDFQKWESMRTRIKDQKISAGTSTQSLAPKCILIGEISEEFSGGYRILSGNIKNIGGKEADFVKITFYFDNHEAKNEIRAYVKSQDKKSPKKGSHIDPGQVSSFRKHVPKDVRANAKYTYKIEWSDYDL